MFVSVCIYESIALHRLHIKVNLKILISILFSSKNIKAALNKTQSHKIA